MSDNDEIGDRHSRAVNGLGTGSGMTVRVRAGNLKRAADQQLIACLVNLLSRMAGTVAEIEIDVPAVELTVSLPNGNSRGLAFDRLRELAQWAVGDAVPVTAMQSGNAGVFTVSLDRAPDAYADLYVAGAGWLAWVGPNASAVPPMTDQSNPIGPWFAACLVAGEVFKRARGVDRGRFASDDGYCLWDGSHGPFSTLVDGPPLASCSLPPFYLIGAGAVGQGVLALVGASELNAYVVTIDDDVHDGTNLNRCFIAGKSDVGYPKVDAVSRFRAVSGVGGAEFHGTLQQFQQHDPLPNVPAALAASQQEGEFEIVVSAVDKNTSRWDVQGLGPRVIIGGSTDQLTAKAMTYGMYPDEPCLACHNPKEEDGARKRELEQQIRELDEEAARALLLSLGIGDEEASAVLEYVRTSPVCGSLGNQVLDALSTASPREFSVSFVSMAAAVLAFTRLVQVTCFPRTAPRRQTMSSFAFRNLSGRDDGLSRDPSCPFCPITCSPAVMPAAG
jgi:molybdopterin/thiamine biosynthesis adenylyltransferase